MRPYPFFAPLASGPRHLPPIPAEIPRTPSSHHIYSRSIVIKISPFHRISPHEGFSDSPVPSVVEILVLLEGALRRHFDRAIDCRLVKIDRPACIEERHGCGNCPESTYRVRRLPDR